MFERSTTIALLGGLIWLTTPQQLARAESHACSSQGLECLVAVEQAIVNLFASSSRSVIQVTALSGLGNKERFRISIGSGFVWDAFGNVVTNEHVVRNAESISIGLVSGEQFEAAVVGRALNYDLAVLRPKQALLAPLEPITRGTSTDLKVGQFAYAIGSPFGLDQSLSVGVISALRRQLPTAKGRQITNMIQTTASIFPGNSGGPLLDSSGRLIGVNTVAYGSGQSATSLGFAIPVDLVNRVVPELIRAGRIPTAGIGIVPERLSDSDGRYIEGVVIGRIISGSPADRAGLLGTSSTPKAIGDIIVKADGQLVRNIFDLTSQLEHIGIGQVIQLEVNRNGTMLKIEVEIIDIDDPSISAGRAK